MTQCFRDSQRLLSAADYRRVFQETEQKAGQKEVLLLARNNDHPRHRLGLAIAKKHVPTAVKRNLIKRLTRECFRHLDKSSPCMDVVVLSRPGANSASRVELRNALLKQFARLGLSPG